MTDRSPTSPAVNRRFQGARTAYLAAHATRSKRSNYQQLMGEWLRGYLRSLATNPLWNDQDLAETVRGISAALDDIDDTESVESVDQLVALVAAVDAAGAQS